MRKVLDNFISVVTPARVTAAVAYVVGVVYPGVSPDLRVAIVGAVTGVYVLGVTAVEVAERRSGAVSSSPRSVAPRKIEQKETRVIR